jgi:FAD/FMN-containing dehydrogenase
MAAAPLDTSLPRRARYSEGAGIYRIVPRAVAHPATLEELREVIAAARRAGLPLVPRGAGSAMGGDNVGSGVVVDLSGFDPGHCVVVPDERLAYLSPSITCDTLNALAARAGLRLPPDPSSSRFATLGGMVSTNASGARTVRYGSVRPWVQSVTLTGPEGDLFLERGSPPNAAHPIIERWHRDVVPRIARNREEITARFPKVRKNSAGYALDHFLASGELVDLVVGAEGTLGVVTQIGMRLDPIPARRGALRVALRSRDDLVPAMELLRQQQPSSIEFLDASFLRLIDGAAMTPERPGLLAEAAGLLLADLESDDFDDLTDRAAAAVKSLASISLDTRFAIDPAEVERLWAVRHGASPALARIADGRRSLQVIEDGCVPPARFAEYITAVEVACRRQAMDVVMFGHAGDGHLHVNLLPNLHDADWLDRVRAIYNEVTSATLALGGTPSGEHGVGRLRSGLLERLYGPEVMGVFAAIKEAFDPDDLFNPGVITGASADPFHHLKVGAEAAILPEGAAEFLRGIETGARWGEARWMSS